MKIVASILILLMPCSIAHAQIDASDASEGADRSVANDKHPVVDALSPPDALKSILLPPGFELQLVAAEPLIADPVAIDWGPDGRLWVCEMADYPLGLDGAGQRGGRIRFLEDTDHDGVYDRSTLFAENLNFPNGVMAWRDGVLITAAPEILFARDTDGDGKADDIKPLYTGLTQGNQQLRVNGLRWGLENKIHLANGWRSSGRITSTKTGNFVEVRGRDLRINPDAGSIETVSGPTQYGRSRDDWGNWFGLMNAHPLWHYVIEDRYLQRHSGATVDTSYQKLFSNSDQLRIYPAKPPEKRYHNFHQANHFTSACGNAIYRDVLMFNEANSHAFTCEPFHNLVHHAELTEAGVSFTASRSADEQEREFFASTDRWCRPVMARTGPDGAVWIVDMYRYVIEHPAFLPPAGKEELEPHYRTGSDRGRIYRVVRKDVPLRNAPNLSELPVGECVDLLSHRNGIVRDLAHKRLIWQRATDATDKLRDVMRDGPPLARLHALSLLTAFERLSAGDLRGGLTDAHPAIRRLALQMWESSSEKKLFAPQIRALRNDADAKVRLQLACSVGASPELASPELLWTLFLKDGENPFSHAAILSSVHRKNVVPLLDLASKHPEQSLPLLKPLSRLAFEFPDQSSVQRVVRVLTNQKNGFDRQIRWTALADVLNWLKSQQRDIFSEPLVNERQRADIMRELQSAYTAATEPNQPTAIRLAAISLLGFASDQQERELLVLVSLLQPRQSPMIQQAALEALGRFSTRSAASHVLNAWPSLSPAVRATAVQTMIGRRLWHRSFLQAIEAGTVRPEDLSAAQRRLFIQQSTREFRNRIRKALDVPLQRRANVVAAFQPAIALSGDFDSGRELFRKTCSTCHELEKFGKRVGPDLRTLTDRTRPNLLAAILDPSANVDPRYRQYSVVTVDGRVVSGLLAGESEAQVTLVDSQGKQHDLARSEIEEIKGSRLSVMPEGLEKDLSHQKMADLLTYLETTLGQSDQRESN